MKCTLLRSLLGLAAMVSACWCVPSRADIGDDFDDGNDTSPPWLFTDLFGNGTRTFPSGAYTLRGTAATSVHLGETFTDVTVSADLLDWDPAVTGGMSCGLVARYDAATVSGYAITVDADGTPGLNFLRFANGSLTGNSEGPTISIDPVTQDYILTLNISGSLLSASLALKSSPSVPISSLTYNDTTFSGAGYTGFIVVHDQLNGAYYPSATFDNFSAVTPVPEPSTFVLLAAGCLAMAGVVRRRK